MVFFSFSKSGLSNTRPTEFYNIARSRLEILKILLPLFLLQNTQKKSCRTKYKAFYTLEYFDTEIFKHEHRRVNVVQHVAVPDVKFGVLIW
jgi:hypothetical protein